MIVFKKKYQSYHYIAIFFILFGCIQVGRSNVDHFSAISINKYIFIFMFYITLFYCIVKYIFYLNRCSKPTLGKYAMYMWSIIIIIYVYL